MAIRFNPDSACCEPIVCGDCDGDPPDEWQVVLAGLTNNSCLDCADFNGTWVLGNLFVHPVSAFCVWRVQVTPTICGTDPTYLSLFVQPVGGGNYIIRVFADQDSLSDGSDLWFVNETFGSKPVCNAVSGQSLTNWGGAACNHTLATCVITAL